MDETKDRIAPYIDQNPDVEARMERALEIRKAMGIYGQGGRVDAGSGGLRHYMPRPFSNTASASFGPSRFWT